MRRSKRGEVARVVSVRLYDEDLQRLDRLIPLVANERSTYYKTTRGDVIARALEDLEWRMTNRSSGK